MSSIFEDCVGTWMGQIGTEGCIQGKRCREALWEFGLRVILIPNKNDPTTHGYKPKT